MTDRDIRKVREFNRFYTSVIGLLDKHYLNSPFTLPEGRVLYELHHHQPCSATELIEPTHMDKGYLSRILKAFLKKGYVIRKPHHEDGRAFQLMLSTKGEKEFDKLNTSSSDLIKVMLQNLSKDEIHVLTTSMEQITEVIGQAKVELSAA
ncbi:MAG: MarR family winged helix-turn-helix transcriptional regulator [Cyclobacteriaceae bacterium]|nr:winged helix-turn-helix transcriptional regulator [Cyclobacteriaceae bacterium]